MIMHAIVSKGKRYEGVVQNPITAPWWSGLVSQSVAYAEPFGHFTATNQPELQKENTSEFTIFSGDSKSSEKAQKHSNVLTAVSMQSATMDYQGHFELGFCPLGRVMLPLNFTSDESPIFVNAKQYHGILRRRKFRAKEMEKKVLKPRKRYLHVSRHLHAMRRPRGCGGRFLNTKNMNGSIKGASTDSGNLNTPKKTTGMSSYSVTSLYSRGSLDTSSSLHHLSSPSVQALPDMMNTGHGINLMASNWVSAADNCCNLKV